MTKIKLCGMMRPCDIEAVNELRPDYCGFILSPGFRRSIGREQFDKLYKILDKNICCTGVFVNEPLDNVLSFSEKLGLIQLHGKESEEYIRELKKLTGKPISKAFVIREEKDLEKALQSPADYILLDSGTGTGKSFDHSLIKNVSRPYFLAGGLGAENAGEAIDRLHPFAVDASSSLETNGYKDKTKMAEFVNAVRRKG